MTGELRVITVTYSPGPTLDVFLTSLATATALPYHVVMADNGSVDGAPQAAAGAGRATLVHTGGNLGYGTAANIGAEGADGDWIVVANPDVIWQPGSLDELLAVAERWPRAGVLGPRILEDGRLYPSARALPSVGHGIGHAALGWCWPDNPWTRSYRRQTDTPVEGECGWLSGSCMLIRREAFEQAGGFDPSYFMFVEDVDLCERIGKAGWQIVYAPSATIEHLGGASWRDQPQSMVKAHHASMIQYLRRRYHAWWQWPLRLVLDLGLRARWMATRIAVDVARWRGKRA